MSDHGLNQDIDFLVSQSNKAIQIIADDFADVSIADIDTGAGIGQVLLGVVAGKEPVFLPLPFVNCSRPERGSGGLRTGLPCGL